MRYGKEKNEFWVSVLGITIHFYTVPDQRLHWWTTSQKIVEYEDGVKVFEWTPFFGVVFIGRGLTVSNFEQKKQQQKWNNSESAASKKTRMG